MPLLRIVLVLCRIIWAVSAFIYNNQNNNHAQHTGSNIIRTLGNRRFEFCTSDHVYWQTASDSCRQKGGHLATIPDAQTQQFLEDTLRNHVVSSFWIGLNDMRREAHWIWDNGQPLTGYTNWGYGEADETMAHSGTDCVVIDLNDNGKWHDRICHWFITFGYICQFGEATNHTGIPVPTATSKVTSRASTTTTATTTPSTTTAATTTATTTTRPTTSTPTQSSCKLPDCDVSCPMGYSGLHVDTKGCIACSCF